MNDTMFTLGLFAVIAVLVGVWLSKRGENTRTVLTGPSKEEIEIQRERFTALTVKELKQYIKTKGHVGRLPTKKVEIVEVALQLWRAQPW